MYVFWELGVVVIGLKKLINYFQLFFWIQAYLIVNLSVVLYWEDLYIQSIFSMEAYFMHLSVALCSWEDLHIH